jgi:DeoR family transcriptional regulator of aga operon
LPRPVKKMHQRAPILIAECRQQILSLIQTQGRVLVDELAEHLQLSKITIRHHLDYLESRKMLVRSHGGALPIQSGSLSDPTIREKEDPHHQEKVA